MTSNQQLAIGPDELQTKFLHLLSRQEAAQYGPLCRGIGSLDTSNPKRALKRYIDGAVLFGLASESGDGVLLTYRGQLFMADEKGRARAVRAAFSTEKLPSRVRECLFRTRGGVGRRGMKERLAVIGIDEGFDKWLSWAESGGLIMLDQERIVAKQEQQERDIRELYSPAELAAVEETVYRRLASYGYSDAQSQHPWCAANLRGLFEQFDRTASEKAEEIMLPAVGGALTAMGFDCQWQDGPKEGTREDDDTTSLRFGQQGDDLGAFLFRAPALERQDCVGYVIAAEVKRKRADKKGVGQAMMFAGRVEKSWAQQGFTVRVIPVVISDSECYSEKPAKDYAYDNSIIHLPLRALHTLLDKQLERFCNGQSLITPPHILGALFTFREQCYFEPSVKDLLEAVDGLLASDAA